MPKLQSLSMGCVSGQNTVPLREKQPRLAGALRGEPVERVQGAVVAT